MTLVEAIRMRKNELGVRVLYGTDARHGRAWITDATPNALFTHLAALGCRPYWIAADTIAALNAPTKGGK